MAFVSSRANSSKKSVILGLGLVLVLVLVFSSLPPRLLSKAELSRRLGFLRRLRLRLRLVCCSFVTRSSSVKAIKFSSIHLPSSASSVEVNRGQLAFEVLNLL
jgi:hypothetical protein